MTKYIDDGCLPAQYDVYSEDELEATCLQTLYRYTCERRQIEPDPALLKQLPVAIGDHWQILSLDLSRSYLGGSGCAALLSVIVACPRLTTLLMPHVGLDAATGKALYYVLRAHPSIREIDISDNELGTAVGELLVRLLIEHRRIYRLNVEKTLLINPLERKIKAQLEKNAKMMHDFSVLPPPQRVDPDAERRAKIAAEEAEARRIRAEAERERIAAQLPNWAPSALCEFAYAAYKHRNHMNDFLSMFQTEQPSDRYISPKGFHRTMKIIDVPSLAGTNSISLCTEFAKLFNAFDAKKDAIDFRAIVGALRQHVEVVVDDYRRAPVPPSCTTLADMLYDSRDSLKTAFEIIDIDQTSFVELEEAVVGVAAIAQNRSTSDVRAFIQFCVGDINNKTTILPYKAFLNRLQYPKCVDIEGPRTDWADLKRSDVCKLVPEDV